MGLNITLDRDYMRNLEKKMETTVSYSGESNGKEHGT